MHACMYEPIWLRVYIILILSICVYYMPIKKELNYIEREIQTWIRWTFPAIPMGIALARSGRDPWQSQDCFVWIKDSKIPQQEETGQSIMRLEHFHSFWVVPWCDKVCTLERESSSWLISSFLTNRIDSNHAARHAREADETHARPRLRVQRETLDVVRGFLQKGIWMVVRLDHSCGQLQCCSWDAMVTRLTLGSRMANQ